MTRTDTRSYGSKILFLMGLTLSGCIKNKSETKLIILEGQKLANKHCTSCHLFPSPGLIDGTTWTKQVLPVMGVKLGIHYLSDGKMYAEKNHDVSITEWKKIVNYYKSLAPETLIIPEPKSSPLHDWLAFKLKKPIVKESNAMPLTSMLAYNRYDGRLYSTDGSNIIGWDNNLLRKEVIKIYTAVTDALFYEEKNKRYAILTCIGSLGPANTATGKIIRYNYNTKKLTTIADSLARPVQTIPVSVNKDGLTDYVISAFGNETGGLYLLKQLAGGRFKKSVIRNAAGAVRVVSGDFNHDGWPDLMGLFAQGDEGIWMFLNNHKGGFASSNLLRFPPIYGSTGIQLVDFNHDGNPDILYTAGDNGDYSGVLKPYHGVYIFMNDGKYHFTQKYFYHINGCMKALAANFDKSGGLDIAAISFFPDMHNHPSESFIYLKHTGRLQFTAHEIPVADYGRWLTMAVDDFDGNGLPDIALGNFLPSNQKKGELSLPFVVLKNK